MKIDTTQKKQEFLQLLSASGKSLVSDDLKEKALKSFNELDFPNRKNEAWKNTNIDSLLSNKYQFSQDYTAGDKLIQKFAIPDLKQNIIVFVNGRFSEANSNIITSSDKLVVTNMATAKKDYPDVLKKYFGKLSQEKENTFTAMNAAFSTDGVFIYVKKNQVVEEVTHVIHVIKTGQEAILAQTKNLVVVSENAQAKVIESYHSLTDLVSFSNIATEIHLETNANLKYNVFQGQGDDAFHLNNVKVTQAKNSVFSNNTITLCGSIVRNDINVEHTGEHCETNLHGLYLADKQQHFDNYVNINHAKPNCNSNQIYRGIIDNNASAVFFGKVYVAQDAQKTNADQSNRNILLTDEAKVNSKPQLEIYADDVKCSHGSTTGQIDKEALFYMRARGVGEKQARIMLMYAFVSEAIEKISIPEFKAYVDYLVEKRLTGEKVENQCIKLHLNEKSSIRFEQFKADIDADSLKFVGS